MEENILLPGDPLPFNSRFYIERPPIERDAYTELTKPGALLRIRASYNMGKSSLMLRLIHQAMNQGYIIASIDFQQADSQIFTSLNKFLRWFCMNIARQLSLTPNLNDYWDEDIGSKVSASIYFEGYLLKQIQSPLVLVLNEVNYIFEHLHIAKDFLPLLRSWHEKAKQTKIWQKLRLVVIHATEVYIPLNVNQSPFNVGLCLKIPEFNAEQVTEFARRHDLNWFDTSAVKQLMDLIGGHPYLIHLAFYHIQQQKISFPELLATAISHNGIYSHHLRYLLTILQSNEELSVAFYKIINSQKPTRISANLIYKLDSLGLIKQLGSDNFQPACEMYRLFFQKETLIAENNTSIRLEKLEEENEKLKFLLNIDKLTQIANRRYFDNRFQLEWERMKRTQEPIALILADIDKFKLFNDTYGHQAGDDCLSQVAQAINSVIKRADDLVARYGGEEFVVILPQTDSKGAIIIAEEIRKKVKLWEIKIPNFTQYSQETNVTKVTISLGVACIIPQASLGLKELFEAADQALYQAKQVGRDRTILSSQFCYCNLSYK
ncbi:AAA-like domain-containing protein [Anabaena cylindrica FACHB-243]|uniref:Diguanylate cyclase n=1 Tax=Anabaena cylindrica (strain ATCC 27899 / PCC 7122) TaxID=272123 RepID=K9ZHL3_ANACC|nr:MULTISPECIES: AAA-like domain-containing protein [Anabaena]AFZ57835.1 diguanylate cyclase [Anabaena cylindrica PCC 7122]MBD2419254.1 AAA-like domain-containing protein [Anabaena cylindrica FACHB-243]MBY5284728.1 diguanylate cyclase [Anabaena sp. CCAP 1446/1C]MBY5308356.1 diguanylate cyclase [Anabaena sp. CCAP 1446/1C]MCM2408144.1 AAA-like domain-containing protein [Anabaena sp. CCAP 1446/1C]